MATELELKLMIQPSYLESASIFLNELCAKSKNCTAEPTLALMNGYFDTPEDLLMKSGIALRIRAVNQDYIQTLKTRGSSRVGMHARGEWEWKINKNVLDLNLLTDEMLPDNLKDRSWSRDLLEVFRTDFERKVWLINTDKTKMEVVLDHGTVCSPFGTTPINEIEIELKSGDETGLYNFALTLAEVIPVQVSTVSKAAKGMRLKNSLIQFPDEPPEKAPDFAYGVYWYEMWLVYWEAMLYLNDSALFVPVCDAMTKLKVYVPDDLSKALSVSMRKLSLLFHGSKQSAPQGLTESLFVGQVMLKIGYWLNKGYP